MKQLIIGIIFGALIMLAIIKAPEVIRSSSTPISSNKTGTHPLCGFDAPGKEWSDAFDDPDMTEMTLTYGNQIKHTQTFKPCHEWRAFFTTEKESEPLFSDAKSTFGFFRESLDTGKVLDNTFNEKKTEYVYTDTRVMQFEKTPPAAFKLDTYSDHISFIVLEPQ